ncbi:MAG: 50S ribosomal protein L2 [Candidatus Altiarchaeota archaeon]|nr:50S ribosomal protein L2 [Candidatus Altiarchaeota archaeon]
MGKRIIPQRRGRGGPRYRVPSHRFEGGVRYPKTSEYAGGIGGQVISITDDPARSAPVARILLEDFKEIRLIAPEGMRVGQWVSMGKDAKPVNGNILPLGSINEGTPIYNIELRPGDGGKIVRASGTSASVISHVREDGITYVRLPSKKTIPLKSDSRATIGKVAGGGRTGKPMVRAGQAHYKHKARNKLYPRVRGVAMNAVNHPHGGGSHGYTGRPSSVSRNTPPGRKVGHIAPKRTGRLKR